MWGVIVPRCIRFINNAEIDELEQIQIQMEAATETGDFAEARRQNRRFHGLIYRTSRNPEAAAVLEQNWVLINGLRAIYGYGPGRLEGTNKMHRELIDAFRDRDGATALDLIHASAERSREDLIRLVSKGRSITQQDGHSAVPPA